MPARGPGGRREGRRAAGARRRGGPAVGRAGPGRAGPGRGGRWARGTGARGWGLLTRGPWRGRGAGAGRREPAALAAVVGRRWFGRRDGEPGGVAGLSELRSLTGSCQPARRGRSPGAELRLGAGALL